MTAEDVSTESAGLRRLVGIGQETWRSFSGDRATRLGASLAYYSVFALAPLLFLAISLAGLIIGQETAQADLESRLESTLGSDIAAALSQLISEGSSPALTSTLPVLSFVVLVVGASVLFGAWRSALNVIFDVPWRRGTPGEADLRHFNQQTRVRGYVSRLRGVASSPMSVIRPASDISAVPMMIMWKPTPGDTMASWRALGSTPAALA